MTYQIIGPYGLFLRLSSQATYPQRFCLTRSKCTQSRDPVDLEAPLAQLTSLLVESAISSKSTVWVWGALRSSFVCSGSAC